MEFLSTPHSIAQGSSLVFDKLSDLSRIPSKEMETPYGTVALAAIDSESCNLSIGNLGHITLQITEKIPTQAIKMEIQNAPVAGMVEIDLTEDNPKNCRLQVKLRADLNVFMAAVAKKPLQEATEKLAQLLASLEYASK